MGSRSSNRVSSCQFSGVHSVVRRSRFPNAAANDSPLVYYKFDETTGTIANDSSGNWRNGTYTGGVTLGATGGLTIRPTLRGHL